MGASGMNGFNGIEIGCEEEVEEVVKNFEREYKCRKDKKSNSKWRGGKRRRKRKRKLEASPV